MRARHNVRKTESARAELRVRICVHGTACEKQRVSDRRHERECEKPHMHDNVQGSACERSRVYNYKHEREIVRETVCVRVREHNCMCSKDHVH